MPSVRVASFGSRSFMSANITTDTLAVTGVSLVFQPAVDRVRKATLKFDDAGADGFEIDIEFNDEAFEEFTMTGQQKSYEQHLGEVGRGGVV